MTKTLQPGVEIRGDREAHRRSLGCARDDKEGVESQWAAHLSFVIPSEADLSRLAVEGSAVRLSVAPNLNAGLQSLRHATGIQPAR